MVISSQRVCVRDLTFSKSAWRGRRKKAKREAARRGRKRRKKRLITMTPHLSNWRGSLPTPPLPLPPQPRTQASVRTNPLKVKKTMTANFPL